MKHTAQLFITDLDNTIYDWLMAQIPAFYAMVDVAARTLHIDPEQLLDEIRVIHQRCGSSEQPFALLEARSVLVRYPKTSRLTRCKLMSESLDVYKRERDKNLKLFPGIRETLQEIKNTGCPVVGYTEAVVDNTLYRLKRLRILDLFDTLYASKNFGSGDPTERGPTRQELNARGVRLLPGNHRKPDPTVLRKICAKYHIAGDKTVYVGDHRLRDMAMAVHANVVGVWAKYGCDVDAAQWQKLVRVSHMSVADVRRERILEKQYKEIEPNFTINRFSDLLTLFTFQHS